MNKKRILAFLAAVCIMTSGTAMAEYDPNKVIDTSIPYTTLSETDETLAIEEVPTEEAIDVAPVMNGATVEGIKAEDVNGITMIPLRQVAEGLGYTVTWNGESRSIDLTRGAQFITMTLDKDAYAFSRRAPQQLGAAPTLVGDLTYVPLTFIGDIIDAYYAENEEGTYKIVIPSVVTVVEIGEASITVDDPAFGAVVVHIAEDTAIVKGMDRRIYTVEDIKVGDTLKIEYSPAMMQSLPPQTTAVRIALPVAEAEITEDEDVAVSALTFSGIITEIDGELVTIGDPTKDADAKTLVISDETVITKGLDRRIYKIDDLEVGMEISGTHATAITMSIPPQTAALTVQIAVAEDDAAQEEIAVESIEISGTITAIEEELVTVETADGKIVLVVSDETAITKGLDRRIYKIDDLEVGMKISAKHSTASTMSLPPQSAALSIAIANEAE